MLKFPTRALRVESKVGTGFVKSRHRNVLYQNLSSKTERNGVIGKGASKSNDYQPSSIVWHIFSQGTFYPGSGSIVGAKIPTIFLHGEK